MRPKLAGPTMVVSTVLSKVDVGRSSVTGSPPTLPAISLGVSPSSGFMVYVDNFFAWAPAADFVDMHTKLQALIAKFGLPLHELQLDGRLFSALGLPGRPWLGVCPVSRAKHSWFPSLRRP